MAQIPTKIYELIPDDQLARILDWLQTKYASDFEFLKSMEEMGKLVGVIENRPPITAPNVAQLPTEISPNVGKIPTDFSPPEPALSSGFPLKKWGINLRIGDWNRLFARINSKRDKMDYQIY